MKSLKGSAALIGAIGIYAMGGLACAAADSSSGTNAKNTGLTLPIQAFPDQGTGGKNIGPEVVLVKTPTKEDAGQYITLYEPGSSLATKQSGEQSRKKVSIKHSFAVKPSPIFNMGSFGLSSVQPSGFSGYGASTAGNRLTFSYGRNGPSQAPGALDISIGSQFLVEPSRVMSPLYDGSEYDRTNNRQVYNLSVDMGYAGFRLGASFSREKMLNDPGLRGFDIGLGYTGRKWGADVRFGSYKRERDLLFASTEDFYNRVSALEIGAAYQLFSNIRFTGRFTYYSYGHENSIDKLRNSQVFFLGTNVNF